MHLCALKAGSRLEPEGQGEVLLFLASIAIALACPEMWVLSDPSLTSAVGCVWGELPFRIPNFLRGGRSPNSSSENQHTLHLLEPLKSLLNPGELV